MKILKRPPTGAEIISYVVAAVGLVLAPLLHDWFFFALALLLLIVAIGYNRGWRW